MVGVGSIRIRNEGMETHHPGKIIWVYPKMDGFIMENPMKMDDLGVPPFFETPI